MLLRTLLSPSGRKVADTYIVKLRDEPRYSEKEFERDLKWRKDVDLVYMSNPEIFKGCVIKLLTPVHHSEHPEYDPSSALPIPHWLLHHEHVEYIAEDACGKKPAAAPSSAAAEPVCELHQYPADHLRRLSRAPVVIRSATSGIGVNIFFLDGPVSAEVLATSPDFDTRVYLSKVVTQLPDRVHHRGQVTINYHTPVHALFTEEIIEELMHEVTPGPPLTALHYDKHAAWVGAIAAGTIGGVAPAANLIFQNVYDDFGDTCVSAVLMALNDIYESLQPPGIGAAVKPTELGLPAVINFSGGFPRYRPVDDMFRGISRLNFVVVAAACNGGGDVADFSPACLKHEVISVGALDESMIHRAKYSNRGREIDFWAPGSKIYDAPWNGTSAACAIVSGLVALHLTDFGTTKINFALHKGKWTTQNMKESLRRYSEHINKKDVMPLIPLTANYNKNHAKSYWGPGRLGHA